MERLNAELARALRNPQVAERLGQLGLAIVAASYDFADLFIAEKAKREAKEAKA